jgi:CheY-like chemotaxis protein
MIITRSILLLPVKIFTNLNVLIAEDNIINMRVATRFLEKWGVRYEKAVTGKEAVELFTKNKFDIILMDLEMPEMDGYDALALIRAIDAEVPAIAFTAAVFQNMKQKLKASGFSDYMQKPFVPDDLYRKLEKYSGQYSTNTH